MERKTMKRGMDTYLSAAQGDIAQESQIQVPGITYTKSQAPRISDNISGTPVEDTNNKEFFKESNIIKAKQEAKKYPRVPVYSPNASAVLRFLSLTQPRFSMSDEAAAILEAGLKRKYPEIWKQIQ